jgi:hypothetical protein
MNSVWKKLSGVVSGAVLAFVIITPGLQAGSAAGGKFKLPFNAQWQKVGLQAGDYTFSVNHMTLDGTITVYQGTRAIGMVRPQSFDGNNSQSEASELICIRHDGKVTVRALSLPRLGTFYFSLPKDLKVLVAQKPELIEAVPVHVSGQ